MALGLYPINRVFISREANKPQLQVGAIHTIIVKGGGSVWGYGDSHMGADHNGDTTSYFETPTMLNALRYKFVSSTLQTCFLIDDTGYLWGWGVNHNGQLGLGDKQTRFAPALISNDKWVQVSAGTMMTAGIKTDGSLWVWGYAPGVFASGIMGEVLTPLRVGVENDWVYVSAAGSTIVIAIKQDGTIWLFGLNPTTPDVQLEYTPVQIGSGNDWDMAIGEQNLNVFALKKDGSLWVLGINSIGELGLGNTDRQFGFVRLGTDLWRCISTSTTQATVAVRNDGCLYGWGDPSGYRLGMGNVVDFVTTPTRIGLDSDWLTATQGNNHGGGIKKDGSVWMWGTGGSGNLGLPGRPSNVLEPTKIPDFNVL